MILTQLQVIPAVSYLYRCTYLIHFGEEVLKNKRPERWTNAKTCNFRAGSTNRGIHRPRLFQGGDDVHKRSDHYEYSRNDK